jgi:hypothetical protein
MPAGDNNAMKKAAPPEVSSVERTPERCAKVEYKKWH